MVAGVAVVAEVAAMLVDLLDEVAEGRPKGNHLARYSNDWISSF